MLHALIMAGGGGTRFWPRSRQRRPKQFLSLSGERTLLQQALDRIETAVAPERTWVITSATHSELTRQLLATVPPERIIGEPCRRDTAACIGLGAALIAREDAQATMLVMPADHIIQPREAFLKALNTAEQLSEEHPTALVTFGIRPSYPATGYGYIHCGERVAHASDIPLYRVRAFREKPSHQLAEQFLREGGFFWNSGIFVWKAATILRQLRRQQPSLYAAIERIAVAWSSADQEATLHREYEALERISIDYAVMERADDVLVVEAPFQWDDVGSWLALERLNDKDLSGNTLLATHCGLDTKGCVIVADPDQLVATVGVEDLLIVRDGDITLVAHRRDEGTVKKLVEIVKEKGLRQFL